MPLYLVWLKPHEGRNHQLRIHCASNLNAPIFYDRRYEFEDDEGQGQWSQTEEEGIGLHCAKMSLRFGLDDVMVACVPPNIGIWHKLQEKYGINWHDVVEQGPDWQF